MTNLALINQQKDFQMNSQMNLTLEQLESIEAPLTDMEWGIAAGLVFFAGVGAAVLIAT
jgi:hypothetical protein